VNSGIYAGIMNHHRFFPIEHQFTYPLFMMYLDLDELDTLFNDYWLWSINKPNIASFYRKDHLGDPKIPLKEAVRKLIKEKTGYLIDGPIRLLTNLRFWGYCFNPISIYYIFDKQDLRVKFMVLEVNNTPWGENHCYILTPGQNVGNLTRQKFIIKKEMHVSPLMAMEYSYHCTFSIKLDRLVTKMVCIQKNSKHFSAFLGLKRQEINSWNLTKILLRHPAMTLKVIFLIYWQALVTWLKGAHFYPHPKKK